jgi:hypothetical protein
MIGELDSKRFKPEKRTNPIIRHGVLQNRLTAHARVRQHPTFPNECEPFLGFWATESLKECQTQLCAVDKKNRRNKQS